MLVLCVLWLCGSASLGAAETEPADVSLADDPNSRLEKPAIPVIPVREREVWFRDLWNVRINAGYATDTDLGQIAAGGVEVDTGNQSLIGIDVGRPLVDDWRDWPSTRLAHRRPALSRSRRGASGFARAAPEGVLASVPGNVWSTRASALAAASYAWRVPEVGEWAANTTTIPTG
jgi:hypothetical protein